MPPRAFVTTEEAIAVVEEFMEHFVTNNFPIYSSEIWRQMSKVLNDKWTPHSVYVNVRNNRRNILGIARKNKGINVPIEIPKTKIKRDKYDSDEDYTDLVELKEDQVDLDFYDLIITKKQWRKLCDSIESYDSDHVILKKDIWSDVLSLACYKHVNLQFSNSNGIKVPDYDEK